MKKILFYWGFSLLFMGCAKSLDYISRMDCSNEHSIFETLNLLNARELLCSYEKSSMHNFGVKDSGLEEGIKKIIGDLSKNVCVDECNKQFEIRFEDCPYVNDYKCVIRPHINAKNTPFFILQSYCCYHRYMILCEYFKKELDSQNLTYLNLWRFVYHDFDRDSIYGSRFFVEDNYDPEAKPATLNVAMEYFNFLVRFILLENKLLRNDDEVYFDHSITKENYELCIRRLFHSKLCRDNFSEVYLEFLGYLVNNDIKIIDKDSFLRLSGSFEKRVFIDDYRYGDGMIPFPVHILNYWKDLEDLSSVKNEKGVYCDANPMINPLDGNILYEPFFKHSILLSNGDANNDKDIIEQFLNLLKRIFLLQKFIWYINVIKF